MLPSMMKTVFISAFKATSKLFITHFCEYEGKYIFKYRWSFEI